MKKVIKYLPGMAIALVLAAAAKGLEALEKAAGLHFIGASVIALFLGMIINHFRKPTAVTAPGNQVYLKEDSEICDHPSWARA